jgi:hypothetical protein
MNDRATEAVMLEPKLELIPCAAIAPSETRIQQLRRKRYDMESLKDLAASIGKLGVQQPGVVRKLPAMRGLAAYELVAGERRWRASRLADAHHFPAIIRERSPRARPTSARSPGPTASGHHVILLAGDKDMITWPDAMAWAKEIGGDLPDRVEQALLFAHHKKRFKERAYWSNTQDADERWAWCQTSATATSTTPQGQQAQSPRGPQSAPLTIRRENNMNAPDPFLTLNLGEAEVRVPREAAVLAYLEQLVEQRRTVDLATFPARASPSSATARTTSASTPRTASTPACRSTRAARSSSTCCPARATRSLARRGEVGRGPQGGQLPSRIDQLVLLKNLKAEFKEEATGRASSTPDERWAWYQYFSYGTSTTTARTTSSEPARSAE